MAHWRRSGRSGHDDFGFSGSASLSPTGCLSLQQILGCFRAPITEEHAWAVCYEAAKCLHNCLHSGAGAGGNAHGARGSDAGRQSRLYLIQDRAQILVHKDGFVEAGSFNNPKKKNSSGFPRTPMLSENKALSELSLVIYAALDYGLNKEEERELSQELETFLAFMASVDDRDTDDEGIERDHEEDGDGGVGGVRRITGTSETVMQECAGHLSVPSEAETHFRAVCRALVSEVLELSTFMEKVTQCDEDRAKELKELDMQDWARLWVQCISDLRQGVKLKKTSYTKTPIEYELTPYEILMDDIRSRRYKLNKVMVDGDIPSKVKKDAHDIILDFIRSRPPLRPTSRVLTPARRESTPVEMLMESIRNSNIRSSLRKTTGPVIRTRLSPNDLEFSRTEIFPGSGKDVPDGEAEAETGNASLRKVIRPEASDMDAMLNFSDEEETDSESLFSRQTSRESHAFSREASQEATNASLSRETSRYSATGTVDLKEVSAALTSNNGRNPRRHSLSVCETPKRHRTPNRKGANNGRQKLIHIKVDSDSSASSSQSATPTSSPNSSGRATPTFEVSGGEGGAATINTPQMHANLQSEFLQSEHWVAALKTLDLTLDEVVHIRSVLTKAELEGLPLDGTLKEEVEKGKICFLCMKTRFGFFTWGVRCQLCKQQVCNKCSSKMRIPLEHFASIPPFALSARAAATPAQSEQPQAQPAAPGAPADPAPSLKQSLRDRLPFSRPAASAADGGGSAPSSPELGRRNRHLDPGLPGSISGGGGSHSLDPSPVSERGPASLPPVLPPPMTKEEREKKRLQEEAMQGSLLQTCADCRAMVLQVIRAQRTAQRFQMTRSLFSQHQPLTTKEKEELAF